MLGKHAITIVSKFYEIVYTRDFEKRELKKGEKPSYTQLEFSQDPAEEMLFPALTIRAQFSKTSAIEGLAIITDKPNREVAEKGHNRTPIALTKEAALEFLECRPKTLDELQNLLDQKISFYFHAAKAA